VKCEVGVTSRIDDAVCRETYDQKYALGIIGANSNRSESRLLHRLRGIGCGNALLDAGCGTGVFLDQARAFGFETTGLELSASAAAGARSLGRTVITGSIESMDLPRKYDVVSFLHVLEHLPDPRRVLGRVWDILAPHGLVVVTVPNRRSLVSQIMGRHWEWYQGSEHLFHHSIESLRRLLELSRFTPLELSTRRSYASSFIAGTLGRAPYVIADWAGLYDRARAVAFTASERHCSAWMLFSLVKAYDACVRLVSMPLDLLLSPVRALLEGAGLGEEILAIARRTE